MKHSILLILVLFSLSLVARTGKWKHPPPPPDSGSGSNNEEDSGSNNEETETEVPVPPPGAIDEGFQACDKNNRQQACTLEYNPVCSYVHNCEGGACTITSGNSCTACAQDNVDGYVVGACEDIRNYCDQNDRPNACPLIYTATCAVAGNCLGSNCFRNVDNGCHACSLQGVAYSLPGRCPPYQRAQRTFCDVSNRPEVCTLDYTPVCAHVIDCVGNSCYFTAGNACSACGDHSVNWHTPGECDPDYSRTYCDANNRPEVCTADYTPVCAHKDNCKGDNCFFTAGNACGACGNAKVDWHYPGECPGENEPEDEMDDERTYCDPDDRPEICTADYTPVCARKKHCKKDCFFTAGNACSACADASVKWHKPGEC